MSDKIPPKKRKLKGKLPDRPMPAEEIRQTGAYDASHERDKRCVPIAFELVKMFGKMESMPVGSHVNDKVVATKVYMPVIKDFLKLLIDKDVKIVEVSYIFSLVRQALEFVSDAIDETLNQNMNRVTESLYGLKQNDSDEITLKQLNDVVMRKEKIFTAIKPILAEKIEMKDN